MAPRGFESLSLRQSCGPLVKRFNTPAFHAGMQGFESPTGHQIGRLAQLGEHLPYKQRVGGSIPSASTILKLEDAELWCRGLTCLPVTQEIAGSNPVSSANFVYGDRGEVVNAPDCGSGIRGFDSHRSPHLMGNSQAVRQRTLTP